MPEPIDPDVLARAIADDRSAAEHRAHGLHPVRLADGTLVYAAPDVLINADAGTVLAESIARGAFPQRHVIGADVDSLGYPAALGYDQPGADADCAICESERAVSQSISDAIRTRLDRAIDACDEYTGPDLDVDAVIAAANDHTRAGAIRHDYLTAIRDGAHLQPGERYLDAGPD